MKKKILLITLIFSVIFIFTTGTATAKTYGGEFDGASKDANGNMYTCVWIFDEASETLYVEGHGVLPEMTDGGSPWISHMDGIKNLVIEEGITTVGKCNFSGLVQLKNISFPSSLTNIEMRAFQKCSSLESITFSGNITRIGDMAFLGCTQLKNVIFDKNVESIGCNMFNGCAALENVYVYGKETQISRSRSNQDDGVLFRGCNFDNLTAYCVKESDAEDYFKNDIYTITNWSNKLGEEVEQTFAKKENYMMENGYTLKIGYIEE